MIKYVPLGEVCKNIIDCPHESPQWKENGIPVIRNFNLVNGQIDMKDGYYVDEETYKKRTKRAIPSEGDIIFSREAPIGNCAIVPKAFKCCLGQRLVLLRVNHDICSSEYLLAVLQSSYVKQQIAQVSKRGSIVSNFAIGDLQELMIPILDTQNCIANLSTTIADKLLNNSLLCEELESIAKLLYDYWFIQFDFPDENGKPYKSSGGKMVWNEELKREIPEGWEVKHLPEIASLQYGFPLSTEQFGEDGVGVVRIRDIINNSISAFTTEIVSNEYFTASGDLLVGMDGNFQMNYWTRNGDIVNQRITRIRKESLPVMVIKMQIEPYISAKISSVARSTVGHLGDSDFKEQKILVPHNLNLQWFDTVLSEIIMLKNENQQLASLRDFLLPMLMNGQVKVGKGDE